MDIVPLLYELARREREEHRREEGVYWVTDLVRCPLKREFESAFPELAAQEVFKPSLVLGRLVHMGLQAALKSEMGEGVEVEVEKSRDVVLPDGSKVELRGRIDAIVGKNVGVEIKYARADIGIPLQHHVDQAKIYNWLFDLERTSLVYVTPDRVTEFKVEERADVAEVVERILSTEAPRYDWECTYCHFSVLCPKKRGRKG